MKIMAISVIINNGMASAKGVSSVSSVAAYQKLMVAIENNEWRRNENIENGVMYLNNHMAISWRNGESIEMA
jgi:hypothetical protein